MQPTLSQTASAIAEELGGPYTARRNYAYTTVDASRAEVRVLDAAVFSSPSPSLNSAYIALSRASDDRDRQLHELGYFGAPLALLQRNGNLEAFRYRAPFVAEQVDTIAPEQATSWLRTTFGDITEARQLTITAESRDLILNETTRALTAVVSELMESLMSRVRADERTAFQLAMKEIRTGIFGAASGSGDATAPGSPVLGFSHVPLEAVAELYESLALSPSVRKGLGVVYTPAWIADVLIDRLPHSAFRGTAVDPACGSGTFLVAFLERLVAERSRLTPRKAISGASLREAVVGIDIDAVALESTRLTLDLFARRLGFKPLDWRLHQADATVSTERATTLVGNLPFGHRTFEGKSDLSSAILERWLNDVPDLHYLAVLLPDSFAYSPRSGAVRELVRRRFRVEELLELPEEVFQKSSAPTIGVIGAHGKTGDAVLVRRVTRQTLRSFRLTGVARSFTAQFSESPRDPWVLSPFYRELEVADRRASTRLAELAEIRLGFQAYGAPHDIFGAPTEPGAPVLEEPALFASWKPSDAKQLRRFTGAVDDLRRHGPVALYETPKLIVRTTTNTRQRARLAAIADTAGLWFTDKFIGIWPHDEAVPLRGLAAYLQTRFVELWLATNNPSRKLRIGTLERLPIPALPAEWWERATDLVKANRLIISPRWSEKNQVSLLDPDEEEAGSADWAWFESAVDAAFGIAPTTASSIDEYLRDRLDVSGLTGR